MDFREKFSERLAMLRKDKGLSRVALGERLGITDEAIRLLERGKRSPSVEVLCTISEYFNVSADYLIGRSDDPARH